MDAQAEVNEAQKKHADELNQMLEPAIPSYGVRSLITHYAQEHVLPPSVRRDLERIQEQEKTVWKELEAHDGGDALETWCVIS